MSYESFLASKAPRPVASGLDVVPDLNPRLFPHQRDCVEFGLRQGRFGLFLDTGLGKTLCQLEWSKHAAAATNGSALILTPLAVAAQIVREGRQFGYEVRQITDQSDAGPGINVCNYDRLGRIEPGSFGAVALDESSILKSFNGKTTRSLIEAFSHHRFRMAATATPAPNDHMELGTHAEFLGIMTATEMLMRFFINDTATASQSWRLKRHGEAAFWEWMVSWARMAETPADLGYDASSYVLPPLCVERHRAAGDVRAPAGELFAADVSATTMHQVKRETAEARAAMVAEMVNDNDRPWVVWCDTDYEADALVKMIPHAREVRGSHTPKQKEDTLAAFASGGLRVLISKPVICGFGLNWQHCSDMAFVGRSFSYEAWYQAVRRCWRFGQTKPVACHIIVAEGEDQIGRVIDRKSADHARMKRAMADAMRRATSREAEIKVPYRPTHLMEAPAWLSVA